MLGQLVLILISAIALIPRPASQWIGRRIGQFNYWRNTRSCQVTRTNLSLCFPEMTGDTLERMVRSSLEHTGQTMLETPAAWLSSIANLQTWIAEVENESLLSDPLSRGECVVLLLPHIGNWELANVHCVRYGAQTGLYQPPKQKYLQPMMAKVRGKYGHDIVPTNRKGIARLYKVLGEGKLVVVLPDQVPASGLFVPFFGVPALTDQLASRLIRKTGARAVAVAIVRLADGRFSIRFRPADQAIYDPDLAKSVRAVNSTIENCVLESPEQYQWEYKRFRERPAGETKLYQFGKEPGVHL